MIHTCIHCGVGFEAKDDKRVRYCSRKCQREHHSIGTFVCKQCGKPFEAKGKDRITFCSVRCAVLNRHKAAGHTLKSERIIAPWQPCACVICGTEYPREHGKNTCSDECRREKARRKAHERSKRVRPCGWCGIEFTPGRKSGVYAYCCPEHRKLAQHKQRHEHKKSNPSYKLHKGGVSIAKRLRIFRRDNNTCQLCGKKMRMDKAWTLTSGKPHPLAPTVDHIVPVSIAKQMGWTSLETNSESNLQAAHFVCNCRKGNSAASEQLRMC